MRVHEIPSPEQMRARRTLIGASLRKLAEAMGVSAGYLFDLEHDRRTMSPALGLRHRKALRACQGPLPPHHFKVRQFKKHFAHPLLNNEWKVKWPIVHANGKTYNPDFFSPALGMFIEVVTSWPNYSSDRAKWQAALKAGYNLRIYWWSGADITEEVRADWLGSEVRQRHGISL